MEGSKEAGNEAGIRLWEGKGGEGGKSPALGWEGIRLWEGKGEGKEARIRLWEGREGPCACKAARDLRGFVTIRADASWGRVLRDKNRRGRRAIP